MPKYRRKPGPVVEAMQLTESNRDEVALWAQIKHSGGIYRCGVAEYGEKLTGRIVIDVNGGCVRVDPGDWVVFNPEARSVDKLSAEDFENEYQEVKPIDFGGPDPVFFPNPTADYDIRYEPIIEYPDADGLSMAFDIAPTPDCVICPESVAEDMVNDYSTDPLDSPVDGDIVNWDPEADRRDHQAAEDLVRKSKHAATRRSVKQLFEEKRAEAMRDLETDTLAYLGFVDTPDYTRGVVTAEGVFDA